MKIVLARILLAFALIWLPLQPYAAQTMPYCQKHHAHAIAATSSYHTGCHGDHLAAHDHALTKPSLACDNCSSCHLVMQPALIFNPPMLADDGAQTRQPISLPWVLVFFPEQLQRPPLAFPS